MSTLMAKKRQGEGDEKPKDDRSNRKSAPIQVDKDLARMAAVLASYKRITVAALCSPMIRRALTAEWELFQEEIAKQRRGELPGDE